MSMVIRRAGYFFGPSARRTGANLRIWVAQAAQPDRPIPVRMTQFVRISESPERLEGRARGGLRCPPPARSVPPTRRPSAARSSTVTARPGPINAGSVDLNASPKVVHRSNFGAVAANANPTNPASFTDVATRLTVRTREYDNRPAPNSARNNGNPTNAFATRTYTRAVERPNPT